MMLWCVWCGERYGVLPEAVLRTGWEAVRVMASDVTQPLRTARRRLKEIAKDDDDSATALREKIKQAELDAEKLCQHALERIGLRLEPHETTGPGAARRNLAAYARLAGAARQPDFSVSLLESLIEAIYGRAETE
jgi:uncharacterized protein (TIGR02444 family)